MEIGLGKLLFGFTYLKGLRIINEFEGHFQLAVLSAVNARFIICLFHRVQAFPQKCSSLLEILHFLNFTCSDTWENLEKFHSTTNLHLHSSCVC